jgi:hypothetical protein
LCIAAVTVEEMQAGDICGMTGIQDIGVRLESCLLFEGV